MLTLGNGPASIVLLGGLIFLARICDVTLGTMRIVFISRGLKYIAPLFGFFEMLIWLLAIRQILLNITNVAYYFAYAGGFASGIFVGLLIEEKLAMGARVLRVITRQDAGDLVQALRAEGHGVTSINGEGNTGKVNLIFSVIKRADLPKVAAMIKQFNPKAFYSIEDVRFVSEGVFPLRKPFYQRGLDRLWIFGKGK